MNNTEPKSRPKKGNKTKKAREVNARELKGPKGWYRILCYIYEETETITSRIMEDIPLSRATIVKNIKWLKEKNLILDEEIVGFPTKKLITLTEEGKMLVPRTDKNS